MSLYTFILLLQLPLLPPCILQCYKAPRAAAQRYPNAPGYSRGRKRDIFYSRTLTWKGTFIFADRLALALSLSLFLSMTASLGAHRCYFFPLQNSRGDINAHIRERGLWRGSRRLTIWISLSYLQRISSPAHRRPSNFPYSFSNRLARVARVARVARAGFPNLFASSVLLCDIPSRDSYVPLSTPLVFVFIYPRSSASTRRTCHDQFSIPESFIIYIYNIYFFFTITEKHFNVASLYKIILNIRMESSFIVLKAQFYEHYKYPLKLKINLD